MPIWLQEPREKDDLKMVERVPELDVELTSGPV